MNTYKLLPAITVAAVLSLSACSSTGSASRNSAPFLEDASQSASAVGSAMVGDTISLPDGNPTGARSADVIAEYFAASNRRCRQVLPRGGNAVRIACEKSDGSWVWVRSLTTSQVAQPLPALVTVGAAKSVAQEFVVQEPVAQKTVVQDIVMANDGYANPVDVQPGETLWKFSQRTTGSGVHWQAIAELNDIDDARTVASGMSLLIPPHLAIGQ